MQTLTLKSRESFMGAALRVRIDAEPQENGLYRIKRDEWDRTFGPIMDRATADILSNRRTPANEDTLMCVTNGYIVMDSEETREFHSLMQSFATAKNRGYADYMKGDYKQRMLDFATAHENGDVLVNHTQLEALTALTRGAVDFARRDTEYPKVDGFWQKHVHENPAMKYRTGLRGRFL